MEYETLLNFRRIIKQLAEIPNEQIDDWARRTTKITFTAISYYSTPENPPTSLAYVGKGLFRLYLIDRDGNEATLAFTGENMFMSSYSAIVFNQIQPVYIQALEESDIYAIPRTEFLKFWEDDARWKSILQKITELDCLQVRKRELDFLVCDAQTRYTNFLEDFPQFVRRIKIRHIASYLGLSPESLSRVHKKLKKTNIGQ